MLPSNPTHLPLTPPLIDKKPFAGALQVVALFRKIEAGTYTEEDPWIEFNLAQGEYDQIENTLRQDSLLRGFVEDKIRYDYDEDKRRLIVRMPTVVPQLFIDKVEDDIRSQLKVIRGGSDRKAQFAQRVRPARSTEICFSASASCSKSKYEPDASFWHDDAKYPGVIIEVIYPQKKKRLSRLAENYLLDSDANVRVVVGLDIEYGKKGSRKATLSVWRPRLFETAGGLELRAIEEVADEAFRDDEGNPVEHPGLRFCLSDFTFEKIVQEEMGGDDTDIYISGIQLCQYLAAAESHLRKALCKNSFAKAVTKRRRCEVKPGDEAGQTE